ncbi:tetratricopeptide repeat protein [Candidatus Woesearchaeota archaeon]|nr:tetratricopeptide repeat protein [Candidatus Woesearchaeota archaeon]
MKRNNLLILLFIFIIIFGLFYPDNILMNINNNPKKKLLQDFEIQYHQVGKIEEAIKIAKKYDQRYNDVSGKTLWALALIKNGDTHQSHEIISNIELDMYCDLTYFAKAILEYRLTNNSNVFEIILDGLDADSCIDEEYEIKYFGIDQGKLSLIINFLLDKEEYGQIELLLDFVDNNVSNYNISKSYIFERRGYVDFKQEDFINASYFFSESINYNDSTFSCPYEGLGMLYFYNNDADKAKILLEKSIQINSEVDEMKYRALAKIYYAEGNIDKAKNLLKKIPNH